MSIEGGSTGDKTQGGKPREVFSVYSSVTGKAETFEDPREAGRAFFLADSTERPSVTHTVGNAARTMARTEIHGVHPGGEPRYFRSLPSSHAPDVAFREGFLEAMEQSLKEKLGTVAVVKQPGHESRYDTKLVDDLESFAYRVPARAAQLWTGHSAEIPSGPVLQVAVEAYVAGVWHEGPVGQTVQGEVSGTGPGRPRSAHSDSRTKFTQATREWER
ncbi:MAG: hypothetical protein MUE84_09355 [Hyphomonas sp.]|nr:hypothetical protein [Hyphomonas sp.]